MFSVVLSFAEKHFVIAIACLVFAIGVGIYAPALTIGAIGIGVMVGIMARWNTWAVVVMVALGAGREIFISLSDIEDLRRVPFVGSLYAPVADFYAVMLLIAFIISLGVHSFRQREWKTPQVLLGYVFAGFLGAGVISALGAWNGEVFRSLYALVRGPVFAYCVFFLLPVWIIRSRTVLTRALVAWVAAVWVGICLGVVGWVTLLVQGALPRLEPVGWGWFSPFGVNHNLLGEALVVACAWSVSLSLLQVQRVRLWQVSAAVCFAAGILTLGRSTWIIFALQIIGVGILLYREKIKAFVHGREWYALVVLPVIGYMAYFSQTWAVTSSNSAREAMTDIALTYFARHPWFGWGPGMFIDIVGATRAFTLEFGTPLEAHGMLQKLLPEYGLMGTLLFLCFLFLVGARMIHGYMLARVEDKPALFFVILGSGGVALYQFFNVSYFNSKMWIPLAIGYASSLIIGRVEKK